MTIGCGRPLYPALGSCVPAEISNQATEGGSKRLGFRSAVGDGHGR